jgi:tight adherence protein B
MNPEYIALLWTDPRGNIMSGIGLGLQLIGVAVMAKMVKFEI